ncbi:MAG: hypothetical protein Q9M14_03690 [Mariprofundaceae bacterium]|nr:hypothetical protein [Mariprofundaceae bacterium]
MFILRHITAMPYALYIILLCSLAACNLNPTGIQMQAGWKARSLAAWHDHHPDMMVFSKDGKTLYISCETPGGLLSPSLIAINLKNNHQRTLLFGLAHADALKMAPDGSLWLGEETADGLMWRITEPGKLPPEQRVDRQRLQSSDPAIAPLLHAGRFSHEGLTFSQDGRFAYMADEWEEGCIYRYDMQARKLYVLHKKKGWIAIREPNNARIDAEKLHAQYFNRIEDMETLPDGRILLAETGTGRVLVLDDRGNHPQLNTWLEHENLVHPDNLAWDEKRGWLWITDDGNPSYLWAWDGKELHEIAHHDDAEITGVTIRGDDVYINLQRSLSRPEVLLHIYEQPNTPES